MKKIRKSGLIGILVGLMSGPWVNLTFGAASGNYTDLLPIGAASDTTVISRGSGWALTTLPTSQTFGDALSRLTYTAYQSTGVALIANTTTASTFTALGVGNVGSTTFPASWVATGRTIRVTMRGTYTTSGAPTWNFALKLGTTTVLQTGTLTAPTTVNSSQCWSASGLMTIFATGAAGTVSSTFDIMVTTVQAPVSGVNSISYSTATRAATSVDLTSQLVVNPVFTWGTASPGNNIQANNIMIEFLN